VRDEKNTVIPAKAGIQNFEFVIVSIFLDARLRGHDEIRHTFQGERKRIGMSLFYCVISCFLPVKKEVRSYAMTESGENGVIVPRGKPKFFQPAP
jgi:hypothetical protein